MFSSNAALKTTDRAARNKQTTGEALFGLISKCSGVPADGVH